MPIRARQLYLREVSSSSGTRVKRYAATAVLVAAAVLFAWQASSAPFTPTDDNLVRVDGGLSTAALGVIAPSARVSGKERKPLNSANPCCRRGGPYLGH
jgi:hypothetical protein